MPSSDLDTTNSDPEEDPVNSQVHLVASLASFRHLDGKIDQGLGTLNRTHTLTKDRYRRMLDLLDDLLRLVMRLIPMAAGDRHLLQRANSTWLTLTGPCLPVVGSCQYLNTTRSPNPLIQLMVHLSRLCTLL